jgi:hypothetical protein
VRAMPPETVIFSCRRISTASPSGCRCRGKCCRRTNRATLPGVAAAEPRVNISRGWARIFVFLNVVGQTLCIVEQPLSVARATAQAPVSPTSIQTQPDAARFRRRSLLFRRCYRLLV